ncbi:MAG: peptide/nickel transport system substrate-binding protein [Mariniblastus sp.]|jgi:peptide/nickel transport system substrate-binding protein
MLALAMAFVALVFLPSQATAQVVERQDLVGPFVDGDPFDVIYLNDKGDDAIMKVKPLGKGLPKTPYPDRGQLVFEFLNDDEDKYEVPYSSLKEIRTFQDLLLEEADQWVKEEEFPKAFRNLFYIYNNGGKEDPQMVKLMMVCLFKDGRENFLTGEFELALSIYEDIYARDPTLKISDFPNQELVEIVMSCYNGIIKKRFEIEDYVGVRKSLESVVKAYPNAANQLNSEWTANFTKRSDDLVALAKKNAAEGKAREAHLAANQAEQMLPGRKIVEELKEELLLKFPMIVVGVSQVADDPDPTQIANWAARRDGGLTQRTLFENTGLTDEGAKLEFLNGTIFPADEIGLTYTMEIDENPTGFAVPPISAYEVSARLLSLADSESPDYKTAWAKIFQNVEIEGENRVTFTLRSPFVRPEALLKIPYAELTVDSEAVQNGRYILAGTENDLKTFVLNPRYERVAGRQHPVVVEQLFQDASVAADQLIAGNIDIVDRVPIADLKRLKASPDVKVRSYILPTVHMLVPKIRSQVANDPNFRNGLSHAIDRNMLVNEVICNGEPVDGCDVISGPFPIGTEENDQIAYAYDLKVRPLAFNSQMGMVMVNLSLRPNPPRRPEPIPTPKLVIAHTSSTSASNAAAAIARMWSEIGIDTETRLLRIGQTVPEDDNWDFLYLEVTMEEPLADAAQIIGPEGIAAQVSAPIEQTLRNLSYAETWQSACSDLRRLHRQTAIDLSIIPLWQIKEHYAYRTTVREIGRDLIHLYQNVDRWKIDLTAEEEQQGK